MAEFLPFSEKKKRNDTTADGVTFNSPTVVKKAPRPCPSPVNTRRDRGRQRGRAVHLHALHRRLGCTTSCWAAACPCPRDADA